MLGIRPGGKTCVITGGAGSIGPTTARLMLEQGAKVVLLDRDRGALEADVADEAAVKGYVAAAVHRIGGIDALFANAVNFGLVAPIEDDPAQVLDEVLRVHVRGAFLAAKHAVRHMGRGGSIDIMSSVAGLRGGPGVLGCI